MRTLIAGVGYANLSDLSVGPLVAGQLRQEAWPAHIEVEDLSYGPIAVVHRFAEASPPYGRLVLVGAADRGWKTARVRCYRWEGALPAPEEVQARVAEAVTGVIDLDNLLIVTRQFGALPDEVFVVEVQPVVTAFGLEPSPAVAALLPEVRRLARTAAQAAPGQAADCGEDPILLAPENTDG
jgi:hydrogenase maturation protease